MANSEVMRLKYRREHSYEEEKENNKDLRNKILDYIDDGLSDDEISKRLNISIRKITRLKKQNSDEIRNVKRCMSKEDFLNWAREKGLISSK